MPATMKLGRSSSSIADDEVEAVEEGDEEDDDEDDGEGAERALEAEDAEESSAPRNTRSQCFFSAGTRWIDVCSPDAVPAGAPNI